MKRIALILALVLTGCNTNKYSPNSAQQETSGSKGSKGGAQKGDGAANGGQSGVKIPDPNAPKGANEGRQAGTGNDPSNIETADPKGNPGSDGAQNPK